MATINDCKVKDENFSGLDIMSLPTRPSASGMSAAQLQERFDAGAKQVIAPKLNQLIDLLNSTEGAGNIGITPIEGVAGYTVQQILMAIKLLLDDKKNAEQSDREIAQKFDTSEAQALVKEVTFSESTGVFTITKYDGTVLTIDTAIEKVALDVRLDGQQFVLTLADGSEQRVDLSAFLTQTEVKNSDTITLSIESGAIVARIASGSVKLAHLNAEVTAYIEEKEQSAKNSADAAKVSEQNALNSANSAEQSYQNAKACQEQSCLCATRAELSRQAASKSEQAAKEAAEKAKEAAGGDFVTNTEFNNFKENVPTLSDDKLPVQSGGWYIDENTTEEDKAEAQEALSELGAYTTVGLLSSGDDLNNIVKNGGYYASSSIASTIVNAPTGNPFFMSVFRADASDTQRTVQICTRMEMTTEIYWIRKGASGIWSDWKEIALSDKFLPLDGSVPMNNVLVIDRANGVNGKTQIYKHNDSTQDYGTRVRDVDGNGNTLTLTIRASSGKLSLNRGQVGASEKTYNIFGEHNKPSGQYTGNGSATKREIDTGGIGDWVGIDGSYGTMAMLNGKGGWYKEGSSIVAFGADVAYAADGVIYLRTDVVQLNGNGYVYTYEWF